MPRKKKVKAPTTKTVTFKLKSTQHILEVPIDVIVPKITAPYKIWYNFWKRYS